jgi:hypothetical protein
MTPEAREDKDNKTRENKARDKAGDTARQEQYRKHKGKDKA